METLVLVHGAWADAHAWDALIPLLKADGREILTVNLPGHGTDKTSFAEITLKSYTDAVKKVIGSKKDVVLIAHSMAGIVISQVAEDIPNQLKKTIYIGAFLPRDGESLLSLAKTDADSHIGKYLKVDEATGSASIAKEGIVEVFAADAPKQVADYLVEHTQPDPLVPLASPVSLSEEKFGNVKKAYVHTEDDRAVSYSLQQRMVAKSKVDKVYTMKTSHTPFISQPKVLAEIILKELK